MQRRRQAREVSAARYVLPGSSGSARWLRGGTRRVRRRGPAAAYAQNHGGSAERRRTCPVDNRPIYEDFQRVFDGQRTGRTRSWRRSALESCFIYQFQLLSRLTLFWPPPLSPPQTGLGVRSSLGRPRYARPLGASGPLSRPELVEFRMTVDAPVRVRNLIGLVPCPPSCSRGMVTGDPTLVLTR
jgi:hypothetical protein